MNCCYDIFTCNIFCDFNNTGGRFNPDGSSMSKSSSTIRELYEAELRKKNPISTTVY